MLLHCRRIMNDPEDEPSLHRLEGTSGMEKGGLVIMKKGPSSETDQHQFKKPQLVGKSLLGLDKLAAVKRQELSEQSKKSSISQSDEHRSDPSPNIHQAR